MMWYKIGILSIFIVLCAADGDDDFANYTITNKPFPSKFPFGVATAAFQIEGAWNTDGKGEQIWDTFIHEDPSRVSDHTNGDVASDSYHRFKEDIAAMKEVGVQYYRFSIAWSRILPNGDFSQVSQAGIDYYINVLEELKANGIDAMVTLYHWDIPTKLQEKGGWLNPEVVDWFTVYANLCFNLFGEYVKDWVTINEPKQICLGGYASGGYAPGVVSPGNGEYVCARNVLLAHAKAWRLYDEKYRSEFKGRITIVIDSDWYEPTTAADEEAAEVKRQFIYGIYANPVIKGNWPQIVIDNIAKRSSLQGYNESRLPAFSTEEIALIKGTYDYIALNHYTSYMVSRRNEQFPLTDPSSAADSGVDTYQKNTWSQAAISWFRVVPWGFGRILRWLKATYGDIEIVITENGVSDTTGTLEDDHRIDYLRSYMSHLLDAIHDGVNVTAYTLWSIIDNFEWTQGFNAKLGIYYVNMSDPLRPRIAKKSSKYYNKIIQTRCLLDSCKENRS